MGGKATLKVLSRSLHKGGAHQIVPNVRVPAENAVMVMADDAFQMRGRATLKVLERSLHKGSAHQIVS